MNSRRNRPIDLLAVGEILIDFISETYATDFDTATTFRQFQGGSPANLSLNMSLLGNRVKLIGSVGKDAMGKFLYQKMGAYNVDLSDVAALAGVPTSLILVTRSKTTPDFEAYRSADCEIAETQLSPTTLADTTIFHTTCFALSRKPAQTVIYKAAEAASAQGCQLSIDLNYAQKIWNDRQEAKDLVRRYCSYGAIVKVSDVDWERLYPKVPANPTYIGEFFMDLGAREVCVTLGERGAYAVDKNGGHFIETRPLDVVDTTGAGDAFWSGYLTAWLDGHNPKNCALAGRSMAEHKLTHLGTLQNPIDRQSLLVLE